jgi:hypothetical protein
MSWDVIPDGRTGLSSLLDPLLDSYSLDPLWSLLCSTLLLEFSSPDPLWSLLCSWCCKSSQVILLLKISHSVSPSWPRASNCDTGHILALKEYFDIVFGTRRKDILIYACMCVRARAYVCMYVCMYDQLFEVTVPAFTCRFL